MKVWTVTAEAVYDHGCYGVFATVEEAEAHAMALWNLSDGHHGFRIDEFTVGVGRADDDRRLAGWSDSERATIERVRAEKWNEGPRVHVTGKGQ